MGYFDDLPNRISENEVKKRKKELEKASTPLSNNDYINNTPRQFVPLRNNTSNLTNEQRQQSQDNPYRASQYSYENDTDSILASMAKRAVLGVKSVFGNDEAQKELRSYTDRQKEYKRYAQQAKTYADNIDYENALTNEKVKNLLEQAYKADDEIYSSNKTINTAPEAVKQDKNALSYAQKQFYNATVTKKEALKKIADLGYDADELFDLYSREQNKVSTAKLVEQSKQFENEHPVLSNAVSVATNLSGAVEGTKDKLARTLTGNDVDAYSRQQALTHFTNAVREQSKENIRNDNKDNFLGKDVAVPLGKNSIELGTVGEMMYDAGMSAADNLYNNAVATALTGGIGSSLGAIKLQSNVSGIKNLLKTVKGTAKTVEPVVLGIMATNAYNNAYNQNLINGMSDTEANIRAAISGGIEVITEKIGMDKIIEGIGGNLSQILLGAVAEGGEEVLSNWLNRIVDAVADGDENEYKLLLNSYIENGESEEQAYLHLMSDIIGEDMQSGIIGALSGAMMSGGSIAGYAANKASNNAFNSNFGQSVLKNGSAIDLLEAAKLSDNDQIRKSAEKALSARSGKKATRLIGETAVAMSDNYNNSAVNDSIFAVESQVRQKLTEQGVSISKAEKTASAVADAIVNNVKTNNKSANEVISEIKANETDFAKAVNNELKAISVDNDVKQGYLYSLSASKNGGTLDSFAKKNNFVNENGYYAKGYTVKVGDNTVKVNANKPISVDNGKVKLNTYQNSKVVPVAVESVIDTVSSKTDKALIEEVQKINADELGMNTIIVNYDGQAKDNYSSPNAYVKSAELIYSYGKLYPHKSFDSVMSIKGFPIGDNLIPVQTAKNIFTAGQTDAITQDKGKKQAEYVKADGKKEGEFTDNAGDDVNTETKEFLTVQSKALGVDVEIVSNDNKENGQYIPSVAKIVLNASQNKKNWYSTSIHELVHFTRNYAPKAYENLENAIIDWFVETEKLNGYENAVQAYIREYGKDNENFTRADAKEEITADSISALFSTKYGVKDFVNYVAKQYKQKAQEIFYTFKEWINNIINSINSMLKYDTLSPLQKSVLEMDKKQAISIRKQFLSALTEATKNYQYSKSEQKNNTDKGDMKYSLSPAELDKQYLSAVKNNDTETAQRMVEETAEKSMPDSKVRDNKGNLKLVYHGRVSEFNVFDREYSNIEGDFGKGFYFTDNENDVDSNYANVDGQDLTNKMERYADRLEAEDGLSRSEAYDKAYEKYILGEENTVSAYLNIKNPVYITPNEKGTFLDFDDGYDAEADTYYDASGEFVEFVEALNYFAKNYDWSGSFNFDFLYEYAYDNMGMHASDAVNVIKKRVLDELVDENGDIAVNEIIRLAFEEIGYDGIIDSSVGYKFRNMPYMTTDTTHYIVFNSNQIKSADLVTYDDNGNVIPLSERFKEDNNDIRYSRDVDFEEYDENFDRKVANSFGITKINDYRQVQIKVFDTLVNEGFFDENKRRIITNANSGMQVEINESGIEEAFDPKNYGSRGKRLKILKLASIRRITDVIENGTLIFDNDKNYHSDKSNIKYAYIEDQIHLNGKPFIIRVTVRKSLQKNKFWVHNIYTNEKNTTDLSAGENISKTDYLTDSDSSMLTQDLSNVKFSKDVTFTQSEIDSLQNENRELRKRNKQLEKANANLKEQFKLTGNRKLKPNTLNAVASRIKREWNTTLSVSELSERISQMYSRFLDDKENLTWETLVNECKSIAQDAFDTKKQELAPEAKEMLSTIRKAPISLDEIQKGEAAYYYGSYNDYRKHNFGKINLKNDGVQLDIQWQEWAELYPEFFDRSVSSAEQPIVLLDIIDSISTAYDENYGIDEQEAVYHMALELADAYLDIPVYKTFADKKQTEINRAKILGKQALADLKKKNKEKYDNDIAAIKEKYQDRIKREKAEKWSRVRLEQLAKTDALKKQREKLKDNQLKAKYKDRIKRKMLKISKMGATQSQKEHIPGDIIEAVKEIIEAINLGYKNENNTLKENLNNFANAFHSLDDNGAYAYLVEEFNEVTSEKLKAVISSIGNKKVIDMTSSELREIDEILSITLSTINNLNKRFIDDRNLTIQDTVAAVTSELEEYQKSETYKPIISNFAWNSLKPIYAFRTMGSDTLTTLYKNVRNGEDLYARELLEAKDFITNLRNKYNYNSWNLNKPVNYTTDTGEALTLSLGEVFSIYALSRREQGLEHLTTGGYVLNKNVEAEKVSGKIKDKLSLKEKNIYANQHHLSYDDVFGIIGTLSDKQIGYIKELQGYLSTDMAQKGNEVTKKLWDIELFREQFYFPINVWQSTLGKETKEKGQMQVSAKRKNSGFTKAVVPNAKNPIILDDFDNVCVSHIEDMLMYHAFVLPLEDFQRVFGYKAKADENGDFKNVYTALEKAYGSAPARYIKNLIDSVNGNSVISAPTKLFGKAISNFKKASVMSNASVVVQQPSAIGRALALIDVKYFAKTVLSKRLQKQYYDEAKQYAPIFIIKEMGYFDTNMSKSAVEFLGQKEYEGKEKVKAFLTDKSVREDAAGYFASKADEITWTHIWQACKAEAKDLYPNLTKEEQLQKAGEKVTEVMTRTQVYDSVFSRNGFMRDKDGLMSMATAFMSEPTTNMNMALDAVIQSKRGKITRKQFLKIGSALVVQAVLNGLLKNFIIALRDDDEDKTYLEKYLGNLPVSILEGFNPIKTVIFFKDIYSIIQGYDVSRMDMSVVSDLVSALYYDSKNVANGKMAWWDAGIDITTKAMAIFGSSVKNIYRDAKALVKTVKTEKNIKRNSSAQGVFETFVENFYDEFVIDNILKFVSGGKIDIGLQSEETRYANALSDNDEEKAQEIKDFWLSNNPDKTEDDFDKNIASYLAENDERIIQATSYRNSQKITDFENLIVDMMAEGYNDQTLYSAVDKIDNKVKKAAQDYLDSNTEEYEEDISELVKLGYDEEILKSQVEEIAQTLTLGDDSTTIKGKYDYDDLYNLWKSGGEKSSNYKSVYKDIVDTLKANGKSEDKAEELALKSIQKRYKEDNSNFELASNAYEQGNMRAYQRYVGQIASEGKFSKAEIAKMASGSVTKNETVWHLVDYAKAVDNGSDYANTILTDLLNSGVEQKSIRSSMTSYFRNRYMLATSQDEKNMIMTKMYHCGLYNYNDVNRLRIKWELAITQ